ncbi:MAG: ABC transporter ATP-binding protein [Deltaproteobacteria bacterium]|jgi:putative ABC transport system ATP-binding protein|nr:ABC transporter ATP-binding protein [Deltaproteobacteria bacterium]
MLQALTVTKRYPGADKAAVDNLSLTIQPGEFLGILGRSGSGKSTLLHILSSLILPDSGQVLLRGIDICAASEHTRNHLRRTEFAVVFQQHHLMPYLSALENVLLPFMGGLTPVTAAERAIACDMLARVGLADKAAAQPGKLSGGEQQRVAIARALTRGARILFADEPTGSLDSATGASIMSLLADLNRDGMTVVMVTHNPEYAGQAHRIITMADGRIAA